ncbi:hypothetical protein N657DRAFT_632387 [Parathielavia appendiculata]|uniref:Calcineurin-like phosphoesterase domain-containing protein n=1 Tax=Parathielavia appendiculata TaxID=2587402 RepID=A0AAN6U4L4_9PEZI|nr:hypothetical protein N657DRAFT_632387 [Parathielavia appendiculata]
MPLFSGQWLGLDALLHRPRPGSNSSPSRASSLHTSSYLETNSPSQPLVDPVSPTLPYGDVLIQAGDFTQSDSLPELQAAVNWLRAQPHPVKIVVAGNHDLLLDTSCDDRRGAGDEPFSILAARMYGRARYRKASTFW